MLRNIRRTMTPHLLQVVGRVRAIISLQNGRVKFTLFTHRYITQRVELAKGLRELILTGQNVIINRVSRGLFHEFPGQFVSGPVEYTGMRPHGFVKNREFQAGLSAFLPAHHRRVPFDDGGEGFIANDYLAIWCDEVVWLNATSEDAIGIQMGDSLRICESIGVNDLAHVPKEPFPFRFAVAIGFCGKQDIGISDKLLGCHDIIGRDQNPQIIESPGELGDREQAIL